MQTKTVLVMLMLINGISIFSAKKNQVLYNEVSYGASNKGTTLLITFDQGESYNDPLYAIWIADEKGNFMQTLYVSKSVGTGIFLHNNRNNGMWQPGEIKRPATLPYWIHQRNIINENGGLLPTLKTPVPDAYTGATVKNSFKMNLKTAEILTGKYQLYFELNQSWDWNDYWHNNKFPNDKEYKTSCQPAIVYCATIDSANPNEPIELKAIGHSHFAGADGSLTTDLSTLTTALDIASKITVTVVGN